MTNQCNLTDRYIYHVFLLGRISYIAEKRPIATDGVAWFVCLSAGHVRGLSKHS